MMFREPKRRGITFVYDANTSPISFDFCWALTWAELECRRRKVELAQIVIVNVDRNFKHARPAGHRDHVATEDLRWRVRNLLLPIALMSNRRAAAVSLVEPVTLFGRPLAFGRRGENVLRAPPLLKIYGDVLKSDVTPRGFKAPDGALAVVRSLLANADPGKTVSITIRESIGGEARNSQRADWARLVDQLAKDGYTPVIVPEGTAWFGRPGAFGKYFTAAAIDTTLRMALYELCAMNLFVNSGPAALCYLSPGTPYLMFKILADGERLSSWEVVSALGFAKGQTPINSTRRQKWVWEPDNFDVLYREFSIAMADAEGSREPCSRPLTN